MVVWINILYENLYLIRCNLSLLYDIHNTTHQHNHRQCRSLLLVCLRLFDTKKKSDLKSFSILSCVFLSITISVVFRIFIYIISNVISLFECINSFSSLSLEDMKLIVIVIGTFHLPGFLRLSIVSFKYELISSSYSLIDSILFLSPLFLYSIYLLSNT